MDYKELRLRLNNMDVANLKQILSDYRIKSKIINSPTRHDFIWLAQDNNNKILPLLLDDLGIEILSETSDLIDKLNGILTSGNEYVNILFENPNFLKLLVSNINDLEYYLYGIDENASKKLLDFIPNNTDIQLKIIRQLSDDTQLNLVKIYDINVEILMECLTSLSAKAVEYLLKTDLRITSLNDLPFLDLYELFKNVHIPGALLNEDKFIDKIVGIYDPKDYRFLIDALGISNDVEFIEKKRKEHYEKEIKSYNPENEMLSRFYKIYLDLSCIECKEDLSYARIKEILDENLGCFGSEGLTARLLKQIYESIENNERLKAVFKEESNFAITNMIIDYHYEDICYNFLLDLKQLYKFQMTEGKTLNDSDLEIYGKVLNLDNLSYSEKIELFEELKKTNQVEKYYDDFRTAKNKSLSMMKGQMLNFDNIGEYKDKTLSEKYGVDIYVLDGEPFYAFVKSLDVGKEQLLPEQLSTYVDGSSYSLDASSKLNTFNNPKEYYNILFGDFNIDQVVHTYPVDSFSKYSRDYNFKATKRVNELYTPDGFVNKSNSYNEIIYSQKNDKRTDELNGKLDKPKMLSLYCYDQICENDIESAKKLGIGITLIKTSNYKLDKNVGKLSLHDTTLLSSSNALEKEINYLESISQDPMAGRKL